MIAVAVVGTIAGVLVIADQLRISFLRVFLSCWSDGIGDCGGHWNLNFGAIEVCVDIDTGCMTDLIMGPGKNGKAN
jgi:hypothetical protein